MKKILIVTGGSGGHVIPSVSLFEHLKKNFSVKIVSDLRGSRFIDKNKFDYDIIDVPNLFFKIYLLPINILKYIFILLKSLNFIKKNNIDILIGTGGYMSFPFCVAAFISRKKIFLFEPNSVLGKANKLMLKFSSKIICYDENLKKFPKKYYSKKTLIYPIIKKELYNIKKNSFELNKKVLKILIIGGSQGAYFFDQKITDLIIKISKKKSFEIIQQVSNKNMILDIKTKYDKTKISYKFFSFTGNYENIYDGVNLAITRGGASTLSELSFLNIPFISIPLPSAKDNHQFYNSQFYYKKNCCWIIDQDKFETEKITKLILEIFENKEDYIKKIINLKKINENNTWHYINGKILKAINEN